MKNKFITLECPNEHLTEEINKKKVKLPLYCVICGKRLVIKGKEVEK